MFISYQSSLYIFIFLVGLCFGSFMNVMIYRLPRNLSLLKPSSYCPSCNNQLIFPDLIPTFSYLFLRGRCRCCGEKIGLRYLLVELLTASLFLLVFCNFNLSIDFVFYMILLFLLLSCSLIDLEHRIVPNRIITAGLIAGLFFYLIQLAAVNLSIPSWLIVERGFIDALTGMFLGSTVMLAIYHFSRGGMGAGDVKLMAIIGFFVGLQGTAVILLLGFIFGAIFGLTFWALGRLTMKNALPFAPFLSMATLVEVLWGAQIWDWYTSLFQF